MPRSLYRLPHRGRYRLAQAGASAYQWYYTELASYLDPSGVLRKYSGLLTRLAVLTYAVCSVLIAAYHDAWCATGLAVALIVMLWRTRLADLPWTAPALAGIAADATVWQSSAGTVLATVLFVLALVTVGQPRWLGVFTVAATWQLSRLVEAPAAHDPTAAWSALALACCLGLVLAWLTQGREHSFGAGPLTDRQLAAHPPLPDVRLPWLLHALYRHGTRRKTMGSLLRTLLTLAGATPSRYTVREKDLPAQILRKASGAYGERRTAVLMLGLPRWRGIRVMHDVLLPGAREANIDHIVVTARAAFVVDSKRYTGTVYWDASSGQVMHRADSGQQRPLTHELRTIEWARNAAAARLRVPVQGVIVVHGQMPCSLSVSDGAIDIIPAEQLRSRILHRPPATDNRMVGAADRVVRHLRHLRARTMMHSFAPAIGRTARVAGPLGAETPAAPWNPGRRPEPASNSTGMTTVAGYGGNDPHDTLPELPVATQPVDTPALASATAHQTDLKAQHMERIHDLWAQMQACEPAPADEVSPELRQVRPGAALERYDITDTSVQSLDMRAMSSVCHGIGGHYIWACSPQAWDIHVATNKPVFVQTIPAEKVLVKGEPS